jgi:ATPase subunit of ABC transporter with duplicated ATPase domains
VGCAFHLQTLEVTAHSQRLLTECQISWYVPGLALYRRIRLHAMMADREVAALNLSKTFEAQLFSQAHGTHKPTPAVVITGFLGAGKTTLVQHLLRAG